MKISNIVSIPNFNVARAVVNGASYAKGTSEELASSMLQHGWDETSYIGVRIPTEAELIIVADYLNLELARLEDLEGEEVAYNLTLSYNENDKAVKTKVTNSMLALEFRETYFNKSGSLKNLDKVRVTVYGHHRTHMILVANVARANNGSKRFEPKALEHEYESVDAWQAACIKENAQRERAATTVSALDVLRQARELRDSGHTESKHRKDLGNKKVGMIQRAWRFLKLDLAFPDKNLYGRAMIKEGGKNALPFKSYCKERLQKLLETDENGNSASEEAVMAYLERPLDKANKPLTMADLKISMASTPNPMLKGLLTDITTGQKGALTYLNNNSTFYKAIHQSLLVDTPVMSIDENIEVLHAAIDRLLTIKAELEE